jgi:hypothetical protein
VKAQLEARVSVRRGITGCGFQSFCRTKGVCGMNTVSKPNHLRLFFLPFLSSRNRGLLSAAAVTAFVKGAA